MGYEVVYGTHEQRQLKQLARSTVKISAKLDLKVPAKKILSATTTCFLGAIDRTAGETECKVNGRAVTRVIYIDEFDTYNSEEKTDTFVEKFNFKGHDAESVSAVAVVLETVCDEMNAVVNKASATAPDTLPPMTSVDVESIVEIMLMGLAAKEIKYAADISGGADAKREKMAVSTFSHMIEERFVADDRIELDKNCSGVLGVDVTGYIRDIDCNDNRVSIKGCVCVNVIAVKMGETSAIYSTPYEFDFNKTIQASGVGIDDTVIGNIAVGGVTVKAENKVKPELVIEADLVFSGVCVATKEIEYAADAICFDNHLRLTDAKIDNTVALAQVNAVIDIESNMTMPANAPYISKVHATNGSRIGSINIVTADGKVTIEGVLSADVVYECEEKHIHSHTAQVPFTTVTKIDGIQPGHSVQAAIQPVSCHIKARRGKELLVDARLGISIAGISEKSSQITNDIIMGEAKTRDDSAIMIYIVNDKETLWDVAKRISVCQAEIIKQNPQVAAGVKAGDKIFIYRQNVINF